MLWCQLTWLIVICAGGADSAGDLLEAVRVHNGDGVVAAVSVHTAEMPNSMAWVSGMMTCQDSM